MGNGAKSHLGPFIKFSIVGASGVIVNEGILIALQSRGIFVLDASAFAIEISILTNFVLNDLWTFRDRRTGSFASRLIKFNALMLIGLAVNLAVVDVGTIYLGIAAALTNLAGIGVAFLLRYALSVRFAWMRPERIEGAPEPESTASPISTGEGLKDSGLL